MAKFKTQETESMLIVTFPPALTKDDTDDLETEIKTWLTSTKPVHVLDFNGVQKLDFRTYRSFILYNKTLREAKKSLYCLNLKPELITQLGKAGFGSVLTVAQSIEEIRSKYLPGKTALDVSFINPFIEATRDVLETQANTKVTPGKPYLKTGEDPFPIEIAGLISLNSAATFKGAVVICFQTETFLRVYCNMVGEVAKEITPEIQDGAGELINIIYGQAKTVLNGKFGHKLGLALPTVLVGDKLKIRHQSREPSIVVPFDSASGPMFIEIIIEKA